MPTDPIPRQVLRTLNALGPTPEAIAATLANKGVKGEIREADSCVIARYLADQFDADVQVSYEFDVVNISLITGGVSTTSRATRRRQRNSQHMELLIPNVAAFLRDFDEHRYPDLVEWSERN